MRIPAREDALAFGTLLLAVACSTPAPEGRGPGPLVHGSSTDAGATSGDGGGRADGAADARAPSPDGGADTGAPPLSPPGRLLALPEAGCSTTGTSASVVMPPSSVFDTADSCGSFTRATTIGGIEVPPLAAARVFVTVADATDVYVGSVTSACAIFSCTPAAGPVYRIPRCGGVATPLEGTAKNYDELVDGGTVLYYRTVDLFLDGSTVEVGRIRKSDGALEVLDQLPTGITRALAASSTHGYVMKSDGSLYRVAHDSTSVELVMKLEGGGPIAVDDTAMAWITGTGVHRAALDGTGDTLVFAASMTAFSALAVAPDATYVGISGDRVLRVPLGAGVPEVLDRRFPEPTSMRVVDGYLYWSDAREGLLRVATDGTGAREHVLDHTGSPGAISGDRVFAGTLAWRVAPVPEREPYDESKEEPPAWSTTVAGAYIASVAAGPDGSTFVSGVTSAKQEAFLIKYGPDHTEEWRSDLWHVENPYDGRCLAVLSDGSTIVSWVRDGASPSLSRYAPDGALLWERRLGVTLESCAADPAGTLYAAGHGPDMPALALRFDTDGNETWRLPIGWSGKLRADAEGPLVVGSRGVLRLGPDGQCVWELPIGANVRDVELTGDGGALVLGEGYWDFDFADQREVGPTPGMLASFVLRVDSTGRVEQVRFLQGVGSEGGSETRSLARSGADFVIQATAGSPVTSIAADLGPSSGARSHPGGSFVARFAADGSHRWTRQLGGPPSAIAVDPNGQVVVTYMDRVMAFGP